jgi:glc operon protein GlcG
MTSRIAKLTIIVALFLCGTRAIAQDPRPYGPPVGIEDAKKVAAAAVAVAKKNNWLMAVAVVDPSGTLVYYEKMDNSQTGSAQIAIDKARTSALFKRPSKVFEDLVAGGGTGLRFLGLSGAMPIGGGIPLISHNQFIGAIGVSGDSSDHDAMCAQAGASVIK